MAANTQFSIALHLMVGLALSDGEVTSRMLAHSVNTNPGFVRRTLAKLSKAGLVQTTTGNEGACRIARQPRKITLLEIYRAVNAPAAFAIHSYAVQKKCPISANIKPAQEKILGRAQKALEVHLANTTLSDLVDKVRRRK